MKVERDNYMLKLRNVGTVLVQHMPQRWRLQHGIGDCFDAAEFPNGFLMDAAKRLSKNNTKMICI